MLSEISDNKIRQNLNFQIFFFFFLEKSKNAEYLTIYTITETKGKFKVLPCKLDEFWPENTQVRINNKSDKSQTPLNEEMIRNQISAVENSRRKWHNTEHFAYFCRYGPPMTNVRIRKVSEIKKMLQKA